MTGYIGDIGKELYVTFCIYLFRTMFEFGR